MKKRDAVKAVEQWNSRLDPADRHHKYCLMSKSAFLFYRGTNHLFWRDFAGNKKLARFGNARTRTWLQGDMHTENMGVFENGRGDVVYGVNDFDDAVIADYQFDLCRMATSIGLVARGHELNAIKQDEILSAFGEAYLETMRSYAGNDKATRTYFTKANTCSRLRKFLREVEADETRKTMLKKWTKSSDKDRCFKMTPKYKPPIRITCKLSPISGDECRALFDAMPRYGETLGGNLKYDRRHFRIEDAAHRLLAGTGSIGRPRYYVLIEGDKGKSADDRILDVKLQIKPAAYHFLGEEAQAEFDACFSDQGQRHAAAYRALTTVRKRGGGRIYADDYLGTMPLFDEVFSVRERSPRKETFDTSKLDKASELAEMSRQWAIVLATVHARAHDNFKGEPKLHPLADQIEELTKGKKREFSHLVRDVGRSYADQVESDWKAFTKALGPKDCFDLDDECKCTRKKKK